MKQLVIMPGGFHPFHAGHLALYQSAQQAFPGADVKVAATNDTSNRPFPFKLKEKLAQLAGVPPGDFYQVKSPFRADEITRNYDPADTQLIFVRSEKDAAKPPQAGGIKRDGNPSYLQPVSDRMAPMTQHAYMAYLPTVTFGPGMRSATEIRTAWPSLDERRRMALVMSLYPNTQKNPKLAKTVVRMLDTAMGAELTEGLTDTDGPGVSFDSAAGFKNTIRQKLGSSDPELNANIDQLVVADPDGTVDVDQTLFNMLKEFDELMPQILQFVKDITAKFIETSQSIEFQQASPADQQSLLQSTKDMQAMLPGLEKQVADARAKFQQNAPIMQQNIQTKAAAAKPAQPVVKEQGIAEGHRIVTELRNTMYQYIRSIVPKWPDYVVRDWLYKGRGKNKNYNINSRDIKNEVIEMISDAGLTPDTQWQLVPDMKFTMDMFNPMTKQRLIGRAGGHSDLGMGIPRDKERHATQAALAQQQGGIRKEPVILIKTATGYNLPEGWHRTIQHFAKYPKGYTGPAWVAVAQDQQGVDEEVTRQMSQGGLRASYQRKYNQPMMEDYLDEARS